MIRKYNTNEDILVAKKSDHQNNAIGDRYFCFRVHSTFSVLYLVL